MRDEDHIKEPMIWGGGGINSVVGCMKLSTCRIKKARRRWKLFVVVVKCNVCSKVSNDHQNMRSTHTTDAINRLNPTNILGFTLLLYNHFQLSV